MTGNHLGNQGTGHFEAQGTGFVVMIFLVPIDGDWLIMNLLRQSVGMFQKTYLKQEDMAYN